MATWAHVDPHRHQERLRGSVIKESSRDPSRPRQTSQQSGGHIQSSLPFFQDCPPPSPEVALSLLQNHLTGNRRPSGSYSL